MTIACGCAMSHCMLYPVLRWTECPAGTWVYTRSDLHPNNPTVRSKYQMIVMTVAVGKKYYYETRPINAGFDPNIKSARTDRIADRVPDLPNEACF